MYVPIYICVPSQIQFLLALYYLNKSPSFKSELNFSASDILKVKSDHGMV